MTSYAFFGRRLVEQHWFPFHIAGQLVTSIAARPTVSAFEGKSRALVMIKQRRLPFHAVVATVAGGDVIALKLPAVGVGMASIALHRCNFEIYARDQKLRILRFVTRDAGRGLMGSQQGERSFRVVEMPKLFPGLGGMTSLATGEPSG